MKINLELQRQTQVDPSPHVLKVATMFGLGVDEHRQQTIIPPTELTLRSRQIIFITGPSGSGKSSLLGLIRHALAKRSHVSVTDFNDLPPLPDRPLVDCFEPSCRRLQDVLATLSIAGLNDAFVLLRKPTELSDGQRYRLRIAQAIAATHEDRSSIPSEPAKENLEILSQDGYANDPPTKSIATTLDSQHGVTNLHVILADEFAATLDRITATVIAANVRKWIDRTPHHRNASSPTGVCFIAATTHDDLLEPLAPDVLIEKPLGQSIHIAKRITSTDTSS